MEKNPAFSTIQGTLPAPETLPPPVGESINERELGSLPADPTLKTENSTNIILEKTEAPIDAGAIDVAPLGEAIDSARVSYHGLRYGISRVREQRARERIAKYARKDSMYDSLRTDNTTAPQNTTNITERVMDARQTKKTHKAQLKELRAIREERVHGSTNVNTRSYKAGRHVHTGIRQATGRITAAEASAERAKIPVTRGVDSSGKNIPALSSDKSQKYLIKMQREHIKADRKSRQPIAKRWRALRRLNAEDGIIKQQQNAQKHLQRARDIKN